MLWLLKEMICYSGVGDGQETFLGFVDTQDL